MNTKTIFGREPAVAIALIESGLALAVLLFLHWSSEQTALVMATVVASFGLYTAWVTKDTMLGVVVGLTKAVIALAIGFGFHLSPDVTAALIAFVAVLMGAFNRQSTQPFIPYAKGLRGVTTSGV
jgi:hypothetical protein